MISLSELTANHGQNTLVVSGVIEFTDGITHRFSSELSLAEVGLLIDHLPASDIADVGYYDQLNKCATFIMPIHGSLDATLVGISVSLRKPYSCSFRRVPMPLQSVFRGSRHDLHPKAVFALPQRGGYGVLWGAYASPDAIWAAYSSSHEINRSVFLQNFWGPHRPALASRLFGVRLTSFNLHDLLCLLLPALQSTMRDGSVLRDVLSHNVSVPLPQWNGAVPFEVNTYRVASATSTALIMPERINNGRVVTVAVDNSRVYGVIAEGKRFWICAWSTNGTVINYSPVVPALEFELHSIAHLQKLDNGNLIYQACYLLPDTRLPWLQWELPGVQRGIPSTLLCEHSCPFVIDADQNVILTDGAVLSTRGDIFHSDVVGPRLDSVGPMPDLSCAFRYFDDVVQVDSQHDMCVVVKQEAAGTVQWCVLDVEIDKTEFLAISDGFLVAFSDSINTIEACDLVNNKLFIIDFNPEQYGELVAVSRHGSSIHVSAIKDNIRMLLICTE